MTNMSAMAGVQRRPTDAPSVVMQGRVSPEVRQLVKHAALRSGTSVSYYLDRLVLDLAEAGDGLLPTVQPPRPQEETLIDVA